jgi:hypothetical protein
VVCQSYRRHPKFNTTLCQFPATAEAIEQGVFTVDVEVDESSHRSRLYHSAKGSASLLNGDGGTGRAKCLHRLSLK